MATAEKFVPEPQDEYRAIASSLAWALVAVTTPGRVTRFVSPASTRRGVVLFGDSMPSSSREGAWRRLTRELEKRGYEIAARASAPTSGPNDGAVEVVATLSDDAEDEAKLKGLWLEAVTAEENK